MLYLSHRLQGLRRAPKLISSVVLAWVSIAPAALGQLAVTPNQAISSSLSVLTAAAGAAASDMTLDGVIERTAGSKNESGGFHFVVARRQRTKTSVTLPSGSRVELHKSSGETSVVIQGSTETRNPIAARSSMIHPNWFAPEILLRDISEDPTWIKAGPPATEPNDQITLRIYRQIGSKELPINASLARFSTFRLTIDAKSMRVKQMGFLEYSRNSRVKPVEVVISYDDYRTVQGHLVPFHIQRMANGSLVEDIKIDQVSIDRGLTDDDFSSTE